MDEALADPQKSKVFYKYLNLPMAGGKDALGEEIKGIEDYIPNTQYEGEEHQKAVVEDICENWQTQSRNSKFHAILQPPASRKPSNITRGSEKPHHG